MSKIKIWCGKKELYKVHSELTQSPVKEQLFNRIVEDSGVIISSLILEHGQFTLPLGLKEIRVIKTKDIRRQAVDNLKTRELKTKIITFNDHSDGYVFSLRYKNFGCMVNGIRYFKFKGHRTLTRTLSSIIQNRSKSYV